MFTHCKQKRNNICIGIKFLPLKQKILFQRLNAWLNFKLHVLAAGQEHKVKKTVHFIKKLSKVCFLPIIGLTFILNRLNLGVDSNIYASFLH